jgi:arylsulfatase A-like enzyme
MNKFKCLGIGLTALSIIPLKGYTEKPEKPNVVFFLVDDLGWKDLSCYGSEFYDSPNVDELADEGVLFTDAYAACPVSSPTRAAIMTGKHPVTVGITDWTPGHGYQRAEDPMVKPPEDIHNMPLEEVTIAEALKEQDYKTFFAGKWHLGQTSESWPENQGFDINKGGHNKGAPPGGYYSPYNNPRLEKGPEGEYLTNRLGDESIDFLESVGNNPFLLYLSFYTVHTPIQGCDEFDAFYKEKKQELPDQGEVRTRKEHRGVTRLNQSNHKYAAMVRSMDENVGRVLDKLEELGKEDNTIIIFTSDNGGLTTKRNYGPTAVMPLRAGKGWCYEGGIRVPLIVKVPWIERGKESDYPVTSMDYYPTILDLAGIPLKENQHTDGKSFVQYLKEPDKSFDRTLVWHYPHYHGSTWRPGSAIRQNHWKLIEFYEENDIELYNLYKDPGEKNDLSDQYPDKAKSLRNEMHEYIDQRGGKYPKKLKNEELGEE